MEGYKYSYYFNPGAKKYSHCIVDPAVPTGYVIFGDGAEVDWTQFEYDGQGGLSKINVMPVEPINLPTQEQIKQQKLQQLDQEYQLQFLELSRSWADASMDSDTELANSIVSDRLALKAEYERKRGEING